MACATGNVRRVNALFREHKLQHHLGNNPVWVPDALTGAPYINIPFARAIRYGEQDIVKYLLTIYLSQGSIGPRLHRRNIR